MWANTRSVRCVVAALACVAAGVVRVSSREASAGAPAPIRDNSFLVEEAYNQEQGVVQHISAFAREGESGRWAFTFTQEWPVGGQRHQLSYTGSLDRPGAGGEPGAGPGDVILNYRFQALGQGDDRLAFAPRVSLQLPAGDEEEQRGAGAAGLQVNLPFSLEATQHLVLHSNLGATAIPSARNEQGDRADVGTVSAGQSLIWLVRPTFNLMLEAVWSSSGKVEGPDDVSRSRTLFVSPGLRGALNLPSGLQVVPGLAVPIGLGDSRGERALFLYLSFEHPL